MDKLFEPFYTTKANGTGLGLPIAKKIIEDHGGNIKINNKPKQGAEVAILLPVNHQDKP
ncbi:MAG: Sensor protein ZraS [bacterium ADurb.Bin478]|nr:MAG: Sensor protein ZraS [bacterium ADurb.Bin478]